MSEHPNPPAFPVGVAGDPLAHLNEGMSLRDWFAGQALPGLLSHPGVQYRVGPDEPITNEAFALAAYAVADAMLAERAKGGEQ